MTKVLVNRVRELRVAAGLSQTALAEKIGVSRNTISSIETYRFYPTAFHAGLICKVFDKDFGEVFYMEDKE